MTNTRFPMTKRQAPSDQPCRSGQVDSGLAASRRQAGATSILFVFLLLTIILLGAIVISVLVIANLRGTRDIVVSTQALYAADTGIELGRTHAEWAVVFDAPDNPDDNGDNNLCTVLDDADVAGISGVAPGLADARFDLVVTGDPAQPFSDSPAATVDDGVNCPSLEELIAQTRALCMTAIGHVRGGTVRRRINNDTDPVGCRP